jgi:hypothetical protein
LGIARLELVNSRRSSQALTTVTPGRQLGSSLTQMTINVTSSRCEPPLVNSCTWSRMQRIMPSGLVSRQVRSRFSSRRCPQLALRIFRFGDPVGVRDEHVAGLKLYRARHKFWSL